MINHGQDAEVREGYESRRGRHESDEAGRQARGSPTRSARLPWRKTSEEDVDQEDKRRHEGGT